MSRCIECGSELPEQSESCPSCGEAVVPLQETAAYEAPEDTPLPPAAELGGDTIEIGSLIKDRFRILNRLGSGNMGSVYRAQDLKVGEDVALKFISPQCSVDQACASLLTEEVRLSRLVSHPNVCRIHDIGEFDGRQFISMEFIDGEDLSSLLRRIGSLHGEKAHQVARQLCAGLQAAHERGVLHRDLKPANVMIDGAGNVRIADFGIAAAIGVRSAAGTRGTPAYMAPELFTGAEASVQSDLFSLGLVLFELYTGHKLLPASSMTELLELHRTLAPASIPHLVDVDPKVEALIQSLLQRDPAARPVSAMAALAHLPGGDPLTAALAYGETPSPALIAEAGGASTVGRRLDRPTA
jgi:serine/threonine-protein kinase